MAEHSARHFSHQRYRRISRRPQPLYQPRFCFAPEGSDHDLAYAFGIAGPLLPDFQPIHS